LQYSLLKNATGWITGYDTDLDRYTVRYDDAEETKDCEKDIEFLQEQYVLFAPDATPAEQAPQCTPTTLQSTDQQTVAEVPDVLWREKQPVEKTIPGDVLGINILTGAMALQVFRRMQGGTVTVISFSDTDEVGQLLFQHDQKCVDYLRNHGQTVIHFQLQLHNYSVVAVNHGTRWEAFSTAAQGTVCLLDATSAAKVAVGTALCSPFTKSKVRRTL
jgi:hypothetical protein